ncbi:hypothetical protein PIIN_00941 [Serendipita indica DSM 11827]|uniref:Uncharacterized protein n=1 Tax=Serendipita indica (strain DSM 11827) TaxID=1109443 RepID=G4T6Z0_SERID|nr:hypothetical protein PIIN_00941 [Serendipita indica DSM 11827]
MATNDLLRLPERSGGTHYLLSHIWATSLIRQLSVTKDFNPGAQPTNYMNLSEENRSAIQYHINQLNRNSFDPRHAVWAVNNVYLLRGELLFVAENLTAVPRPRSRRGQYARHSLRRFRNAFLFKNPSANGTNARFAILGELSIDSLCVADPVLLLHLASAPGDLYEVKSQLVVTDGFQPTDSVYPYFSVTKFWRKAIKTELQRLNNHSEDLRDHAWALESIHSVTQGKPADVVGVIMVLRWMSTEPADAPMAGNYSPMVHSSRPSPRQEPERDTNLLTLPPYSLS